MPAYDYECKKCKVVFEKSLPMAKSNQPLEEACPSCKEKGSVQKKITFPGIADSVNIGRKKPDKGFMEVMSKIKEKHPLHNMKDRW